MLAEHLLYAAALFGLNLLPAFGPPAFVAVAYARTVVSLAPVPMVLIGALATAAGRLALALLARRFRHRLSPRRLESLAAARAELERRGGRLGRRAVFFIAPIPSGSLFMAAGLMEVPLAEPVVAFFLGRLVTHSLYVFGASALEAPLKSILHGGLGSPVGIAIEVLTLLLFVAWLRFDWTRLRGAAPPAHPRTPDRPPSPPA